MMSKPRVIVVCGSLYRRDLTKNIVSSGSDISLEEELFLLKNHCERINVITLSKKGLSSYEVVHDNIHIHRVRGNDVRKTIENIHIVQNASSTHSLITQLLLSEIAIEEAKKLGIRIVYYMRSLGIKLDISPGGKYEPDRIIAVSNYVKRQIKRLFNQNAVVSYPSFNKWKPVKAKKDSKKRKYDFMMVNPNGPKGGDIFFHLARKFKNYKFIAVKGWEDLKTEKGTFDLRLMKFMSTAHGEKEVYIPKLVEYPKYHNLEISNPVGNLGEVFKQSKYLLVPSQWEEAFARVIVEAGLNNCIVIASNTGGIPEAMKIAGMPKKLMKDLLVQNFKSKRTWEEKIKWAIEMDGKVASPKPKLPTKDIRKIIF